LLETQESTVNFEFLCTKRHNFTIYAIVALSASERTFLPTQNASRQVRGIATPRNDRRKISGLCTNLGNCLATNDKRNLESITSVSQLCMKEDKFGAMTPHVADTVESEIRVGKYAAFFCDC